MATAARMDPEQPRRTSTRRKARPANEDAAPVWNPPNVEEQLRTSIGGSVVDEFVAGHDVTDVLRELVQNEFDAGGTAMSIIFGPNGLTVTGNGRAITAGGWARLSVIIGTGRVVGESDREAIAPKTNGIGSKNFGLRSLFIFGDRIYVRSAGHMAALDLPKLATAKVRDPESRGRKGVSVHVPYRRARFEKLAPFTEATERRTLDVMAGGMLATLVKLARVGRRSGLQQLILRSERTGREIRWTQRAHREPCKVAGVTAIIRSGKVIDSQAGERPVTSRFEEIEFLRTVDLPDQDLGRDIPDYYRSGESRIRIGVSLPIARGRIDRGRAGHFYYPLQTPHARTGSAVSVSAPFELDGDRSALVPASDWNDWLAGEAADLATDLVGTDWLDRFGGEAFAALDAVAAADPPHFAKVMKQGLSTKACWRTRSRAPGETRVTAEGLVIPDDPCLDDFLTPNRYLDERIAGSRDATRMAVDAGAKRFTLSSLVRLRCGGEGAALKTKLPPATANYSYTDYEAALGDANRQVEMAAALTKLSRHLSNANREDLRDTESTLAADGSLAQASELVLVDEAMWDTCPEPASSRLHRDLSAHRAIAGFCREFDEQGWVRKAAERATEGAIGDDEREALYRWILEKGDRLGRGALAAVRNAPVVRDQRMGWAAPEELLAAKGATGKLFLSVLSGPSPELAARPELVKRLKLREEVRGEDIIAFAKVVAGRPALAERFEKWLYRNLRKLAAPTIKRLAEIAFLRSTGGTIEAPKDLHLDTPLNRLCVTDPTQIVGGKAGPLYRRLRLREAPALDTLLATLAAAREAGAPPTRPDIFYRELARAATQERRKSELEEEPILWTRSGWFAPTEVLAGTQIPRYLDVAVPVVRGPEAIVRAYVSLGAAVQPRDHHWEAFFAHFDKAYEEGEKVSDDDRRRLLAAYRDRGSAGFQTGFDPTLRCLLDRRGRLHSLDHVEAGALLEDDYPALAEVIENAANAAFAEASERSRFFFRRIGLKTLTSVCGVGTASFGPEAEAPARLRPEHLQRLLSLIHRPAFARALYELASARRRAGTLADHVGYDTLEMQLAGLRRILFLEQVTRQYDVAGQKASVPDEAAVSGTVIGVVRPRTKFDLNQLVAQALAELAGFTGVAEARAMATTILPLLLCSSADDMRTYLERQGIVLRSWSDEEDEEEFDFDFDVGEDPEERTKDIFRHLMDGIETAPAELPPPPVPPAPPAPPPPANPAPPPPRFELPPLGAVSLDVADVAGTRIEARSALIGGSGWGSSSWTPPTPGDTERDALVGRRGEELVYRMEIEKVRAMGHANPDQLVVWTSSTDPGADHDIRSIDEQGKPRWLEVKSTTGTDGRFEWSRKEFERALRERERYELWRVYQAGTTAPVAKFFPDPTALLGRSQIRLDIGLLRAVIEPMS